MKKIVTIDNKRLADFEAAQVYSMRFELENNSLKRVCFETSEGPFQLVIDSYTIKAV